MRDCPKFGLMRPPLRAFQSASAAVRLVIVAWMLVAWSLPALADADADYNLAVELYRQERWPLAEEAFDKFIEAHPDHPQIANARLYHGLTLVNLSNFEAARNVFRGYVADYPEARNRSHAMYRIGEASYFLDDLPAAEVELARFANDYPEDPLLERALPYLADTQLRRKKYAAAAETFRRSLERDPEGPLVSDVRFGLAKALQLSGETDAARAAFERIARQPDDPRAAEALFSLAALDFDAGKYGEAAGKYNQVVKSFPKHRLVSSAELNAGFATYRLGERETALKHFEAAAENPDTAPQAKYWQGVTLLALDRPQDAVTALERARELTEETELAPAVRYQLAGALRAAGESEQARQEYLHVADTWPEGDNADDALYAAAELALDANDLDAAAAALERLRQDYPESGLRMYRDILQARLLIARGGDLEEPRQILQRVLQETEIEQTRQQASYYLAVTLQQAGRNDEALAILRPLVAAIRSGNADGPPEALVLQTMMSLDADRPGDAAVLAEEYLQRYPSGEDRAAVLGAAALAFARLDDRPKSEQALEQLRQADPGRELLAEALLPVAEAAFAADEFDWSEALFRELLELSPGQDVQAMAMSGKAWSQLEQSQFAAAASQFADVVAKFPESDYAAEAALMAGRAWEQSGSIPEATDAYLAAFETFAPEQPVPQGSGAEGSEAAFAFAAGRDAARLLRRQNKIAEADEVYAALLTTYPRPANGDRLLDEWAVMHYEAGNFEQADLLFARLVKDYPTSDLADNARLSLAESELIAGNIAAARAAFQQLAGDAAADNLVKERSLYQLLLIDVQAGRWDAVRSAAAALREAFPESQYLDQATLYAAEAELHLKPSSREAVDQLIAELERLRAKADQLESEEWFPRVWVLAAELEFRLKRYDRVMELAEQMRQRFGDSKFGYQMQEVVGRTLKQQAKFDAAREALQKVIEDEHGRRTETAAKSQLLIAETYFLQENYEQALVEYQRAYSVYQFPLWQSAALLQAGQCDEQLGDKTQARQTYQKLLEEFPESPYVREARERIRVLDSGNARAS